MHACIHPLILPTFHLSDRKTNCKRDGASISSSPAASHFKMVFCQIRTYRRECVAYFHIVYTQQHLNLGLSADHCIVHVSLSRSLSLSLTEEINNKKNFRLVLCWRTLKEAVGFIVRNGILIRAS